MEKPHFDIGVVIPLEPELAAFFEVFGPKKNLTTGSVLLHEVDTSDSELTMVVVHQSAMGHAAAAAATDELLERFDLGAVVCLGIAGSLSTDMPLGEVCYSGKIIDTYENNAVKDVDGDLAGMTVQFSPVFFDTSQTTTLGMNFVRTQPELKAAYQAWQDECRTLSHARLPGGLVVDGETYLVKPPCSLNGTIATGMVSKSEVYNKAIRAIERKTLAIETEAGAVFRQAKAAGIEAIAIRGISDFADENKSALEQSTKGAVREIAARNAASFLKLQLGNRYFRDRILSLRSQGQGELPLGGSATSAPERTVVQQVADIIHDRLRELSPQYKMQPRGYRVPAPRLRRHKALGSSTNGPRSSPIEADDALKLGRHILISVPANYPDQSLPWVFAQELMETEFDGRQVIPIVVKGAEFSPPKKGFAKLSEVNVAQVVGAQGLWPVFIVDALPLQSPTKLKFLIQETLRLPEAHHIFLTNSTTSALAESDLKIDLPIAHYDLCDISFREIAEFIQRSFDIRGNASEVLAKQLLDIFEQFGLSAHPSYFAGIPKETLLALMNANRRAELIQLAVDGYLTLVVADDAASVPLSRTTRVDFLMALAVDIHVSKRSVSQKELFERVSDMASAKDFNIKPVSFLKGFEDKGILRLETDRAVFALPFVERYLLARALSENAALSKTYFDLQTMDFDFDVFDLYAEMGAHSEVRAEVVKGIEAAIDELTPRLQDPHVLLTNAVSPAFFKSMKALQGIQRRLQKAADDVQTGRSNAAEKQDMIDFSDRVQERTAMEVREQNLPGQLSEDGGLGRALNFFTLGSMLIGSGAERLLADEKRKLAGLLITLAASVMDIWTRKRAEIDFSALKTAVLADEKFEKLRAIKPAELTDDDMKLLAELIVDLFELSAVSEPLLGLVGRLCEKARSQVLTRSLENVTVLSPVEKLVKALWIAETDPQKGKQSLLLEARELPLVTFLRMSVAFHCLQRLFWGHWKPSDQMALIDAANAFLSGIGQSIDADAVRKLAGPAE
jgi:nucleoside phosphorylase